jgi:hypothetical protein
MSEPIRPKGDSHDKSKPIRSLRYRLRVRLGAFDPNAWLGYRWQDILKLVALGVSLNIFANILTPLLNGLLFLDTLGTALAAFAIGPWWGALVGVITNLVLAEFPGKEQYFNYTIVNVYAGLFWGYVARTHFNPFRADNSGRHLFITTFLTGTLCGLLCSVIAGCTRLRFAWHVTPEFVGSLPMRHATDQLLHWAISSSTFRSIPPVLIIIPLDAISVIPDKIVSTAMAAFTLYYFLPLLRQKLTTTAGRRQSRWPVPELAFICAYIFPFVEIARTGNVDIDPTGNISRELIRGQIALWAVPLLLAVFTVVKRLKSPSPSEEHDACPESESWDFKVEDVYKDVINVVATIYTLLLAARSPYAADQVASLTHDGIGIIGFIGIFGVLPIVLMRYFGPRH